MLGFTFRGTHTSTFPGLVVKTMNNPMIPAKRAKRVNVPGHDGSYIFEDGYENKLLEFKCILSKGNIKERRLLARSISSWLSGTGDLILDYESDKTYKVVAAVSDVNLALSRLKDEFNISFEVEPFQYGSYRTVSVNNPSTFTVANSGNAIADTVISITGTGDVSVSCGSSTFTLTGMTQKLNLDSKRMLVYTDLMENGMYMHSGGFIKLLPGDNILSVTGTVSNITVKYYDTFI